MQGSPFSVQSRLSNLFGSVLQRARPLITVRRVGYTLAGAFVFVGAAVITNARPNDQDTPSSKSKDFTMQAPADGSQDTTAPSTSSTSTFSSQSSNGATPDMQVNVNGRNVPVPDNGSSRHTMTNSDGSQTTVDVSSNSTSDRSATNSSSSNFSLNVQSNSSSSSSKGGTSQ